MEGNRTVVPRYRSPPTGSAAFQIPQEFKYRNPFIHSLTGCYAIKREIGRLFARHSPILKHVSSRYLPPPRQLCQYLAASFAVRFSRRVT